MNIDEVKALVAIAQDEDRSGRERLAAFEQADTARKELKVGWSKLGLEVDDVTSLKTELPALAALDAADTEAEQALGEASGDESEPSGTEEPGGTVPAENEAFEASPEELAAQTGRRENVEAQAEADDAKAIERAAKKVSKAKAEGAGETRGGLTRLVESLLMDPALSYLDIINAVLKDFPKANTSARSIASVAAGMRRKDIDVPMRRPAKAEKPTKPMADAVTDASTGVTDLAAAPTG